MAQVNLEINGRVYAVGCDDGEEEHLLALARHVDARVRGLAAKLGQVGEARLFLLACLMLADELGERGGDARGRPGGGARDGQVADRLEAVAKRLSALAERLPRA